MPESTFHFWQKLPALQNYNQARSLHLRAAEEQLFLPPKRMISAQTPPDYSREQVLFSTTLRDPQTACSELHTAALRQQYLARAFRIRRFNCPILHYAVRGNSICMIGGRYYAAKKGDAWFSFRWEESGFLPPTAESGYYSELSLYFTERPWGILRQVSADGTLRRFRESWLFLPPALNTIVQRRIQNCPDVALLRGNPLYTALLAAIHEYSIMAVQIHREMNATRDPIARLRVHLRKTLGIGASLRELSRLVDIPPQRLQRIYQARTGETIHATCNRIRFEFVLRAELEGFSQKQIAGRLGFSSLSNYFRWIAKQRESQSTIC